MCPRRLSPLTEPDGQAAPRMVDDKNVDARITTRRNMTFLPGLFKISAVAFYDLLFFPYLEAMLVSEVEDGKCETRTGCMRQPNCLRLCV